MADIIVTKLTRADHGEWEARVSMDGQTIPVTRRFGSWQTMPDAGGATRDVLPAIAAALQQRLPATERKPKTITTRERNYPR